MFSESFDLETVLHRVANEGYVFVAGAATAEVCSLLAAEASGLNLEVGDHLRFPINPGRPNEVRQQHARAYGSIGDPAIPAASEFCQYLAVRVERLRELYPELVGWCPSEIGYQLYRSSDDMISPHRDRSSDQLLSATLTIAGSAWTRIYEPLAGPDDYSQITQTDAFLTGPGTLMFLRAPGFASGRQIIHEVLPPENGSRLIVNLRMRPTILPSPSKT